VTTVAVLGAGRMGSAMAASIGRAGHRLIVFNRTSDRASALAKVLQCEVVGTAAEAASVADICLSMVADEAAVRAIYEGPDGLLAGARPGVVLIDSSTVTPDVIRSFEAPARAAGAGILDAPVSGSVALAESGTLTLMVGGEVADLERARPVLAAIGRTIFHLGPLGTGAAMKLAVNTLIFASNAGVAEALVLAEAAGIPRAEAYEVIAQSAVGSPFVGYKRQAFLDPERTPVGFALELADKDLGLILATAAGLGLELPQTQATRQLIQESISHGLAGSDFSAVAVELRGRRRARKSGDSQREGTTG
jgi:3-hydroxyisobutyrate dehydrogenase-like beta-hydroxyacid dehydrogenase